MSPRGDQIYDMCKCACSGILKKRVKIRNVEDIVKIGNAGIAEDIIKIETAGNIEELSGPCPPPR